jgi:hypothetical protein
MMHKKLLAIVFGFLAVVAQAGLVALGSNGRVAHSGGAFTSYETFCSATENPLDEAGVFLGGAENSGIFANMRSGSGYCYADRLIVPGTNDYTDSLSILDPGTYTVPADQYGEVTLQDDGGSSPSSHEVEILLRANTSFSLYEVLIPRGGFNVQIVHQSGAKPGFTVLSQTGSGWGAAFTDGDVVRAEVTTVTGDVIINVYKNSSLGATATITNATYKILSGNCGIGAYVQSGSGASEIAFSVDRFKCGSL